MRARHRNKIVLVAVLGIPPILARPAAGDGPPVISFDLATRNRAIWGIGGNLSLGAYGPGTVTTAVGDLDGDGILDVGTVAAGGGASSVTNRKGWDGTVKGGAAATPDGLAHAGIADFGDTYLDATGQRRKDGALIAADFDYKSASRVSSFSWGLSNPTNAGSSGMSAGRTFAPYGPAYTGDIRVTAGDVDGDGIDELVTVAQSKAPPVNGAVSHQISLFKPTATSFASLVSFDPTPAGAAGAVCVAGGKFGDPKDSWLLTSFVDPTTASPALKLFSITAEVQPVGVTVDTSAATYLEKHNIIHRDLALRCAAGDLDGDGQDEVVLSGNDGTAPFVDILKLGYTASPVGGMPAVSVVAETPVDLSGVMGLEPADEWSTLVFDPTVTPAVFTSTTDPSARPADATGYAGTLFLATAVVPEPAMVGLLAAGALLATRRRR